MKKFDITKNAWLCTHKFEKSTELTKFMMLCKFAGISMSKAVESDEDLNTYPYVGMYEMDILDRDFPIDRWQSLEFKDAHKRITYREAKELLKKAIKKQIKTNNYANQQPGSNTTP